MKKLLVAVAALFAVVSMVSATTIKWGDQALDKGGSPLNTGVAYLVYLGTNGTLDAAPNSNGNWVMGDDVVVGYAVIQGIDSFASSPSTWGYYNASTEVSYPTGSVYAVIVTDKGVAGTTLPADGSYGISPKTYSQEDSPNGIIDTPMGTFGVATADIPVVPEPTTYALVGLAAAALALRKRFLKK